MDYLPRQRQLTNNLSLFIHSRLRASKTDVSILGQPLTFRNGRTAPNRFLKAALTERVSSWDVRDHSKRGIPEQGLVNLYEKWGNGQFGMILTGNVCVDTCNLESAGNVIFSKENDSRELREMATKISKAMKQDGALAIAQISHAGRQTPEVVNPHPFSCSDIQLKAKRRFMGFGKPIALTEEQIKAEVIDRFVFAAKFAHDHGFDGVQIHGAHGYLLSSFMSPTTNNRTDKYGGAVENRMRVIREIYEAIRKEITASAGFLIGLKTNSVEFQDRGLGIEDAKAVCRMVEESGFDFVELSGGTIEKPAFQHMRDSTRKREAFFLEFAEKIRPCFDKTVVYLTGGFRTAPAMVEAVVEGTTDGVGLGRPATAEPDLPAKILRGDCLSAADANIDQDDYMLTATASNTQMWQMGKRPLAELKSICDDIADLSHPTEAENFKKAAVLYYNQMKEIADRGGAIHGVMTYENVIS
ncbi:hypothetical protein Q1695_014840 [Nippostrongylus brasiliensis]|nr:hypothetical protein Q1695_014840 [Nippostrongylus brasiliensis]